MARFHCDNTDSFAVAASLGSLWRHWLNRPPHAAHRCESTSLQGGTEDGAVPRRRPRPAHRFFLQRRGRLRTIGRQADCRFDFRHTAPFPTVRRSTPRSSATKRRQVIQLAKLANPHERHFDERPAVHAHAHPGRRMIENLTDGQHGRETKLLGRSRRLHLPVPAAHTASDPPDSRRPMSSRRENNQPVDPTAGRPRRRSGSSHQARRGRPARLAPPDARTKPAEPLSRCNAEQAIDLVGRDSPVTDGQQLLQQRLAIAHRAGGPTGQNLQALRLNVDPLGGGDLSKPRLNRRLS